jgi:cell division protein FtsI (penicillin-binding protein 3)
VSNPAISVAVVIDTPTVGTRYGAETSAPVFAQVAQQVLEYLGVPHDQPLKTKKEMQQIAAQTDVFADGPSESGADINALFAEINNLPPDDPLRTAANAAGAVNVENEKPVVATGSKVAEKTQGEMNLLPAKAVDSFQVSGGTGSAATDAGDPAAPMSAPKDVPALTARDKGAVVVNAGLRVPVPSFEGAALRNVVERADSVGLRVQAVGSGLAREQVPAAGTMVPAGTEVVVRFAR